MSKYFKKYFKYKNKYNNISGYPNTGQILHF